MQLNNMTAHLFRALARRRCAASVTGALAAVDVEDLPGHEGGLLEVDDAPRDVGDPTGRADRVLPVEELMGLGGERRGLDDAERDRVHPDAVSGVLDREGPGG